MCYFIVQNIHTTKTRENTWVDKHTHTSSDLLAGHHDIAWLSARAESLQAITEDQIYWEHWSAGLLSQKSQLAGDPSFMGPPSTTSFMQITEEELLHARNTHIYTHIFCSTAEQIASPGP